MKQLLSILVLIALAGAAAAQRSVVVNTNGLLTQPTNFWTANSNAINAVVPVPALPSWISTNPAVSLSNLTTTNYVTTLGLHVPSFSATNARLAYWSLSGNVAQAGVGVNTNVTPDLQASIGLGTNNFVRFAEVSVGEFTISGSGTGTYGGDDIFELRTNGLFINQPALTISSLGLAPTDIVTFGGVAAGVVTNVVGSGDIAAANEVSGLRGTFGELNLGNNGFALAEDEFGRMTLTGDLYFLSASNAAVFRANAGIPWSGLTNTNAAGLRGALGLADWTTNASSPATTNASALTTGTLDPARLPTNVALVSNLPSWATTTNPATARTALDVERASTNVMVTNAMTLPAGRRVLALLDSSSVLASSAVVTLPTNGMAHGDVVEARYLWSSDNITAWPVVLSGSTTNLVHWSTTRFFQYSTNQGFPRWFDLGRTLNLNAPLGALATNNSVPTGAAAAGDPIVADGGGFSTVVANRVQRRSLANDLVKTNWPHVTASQGTNATAEFTYTLEANAVYRVEYELIYNFSTNAVGYVHGFGFSGSVYPQTNSVVGYGIVGAGTGLIVVSPSSQTFFSLPNNTNSVGTRITVGKVSVPTGTNSVTMSYHWTPFSSNASALTLLKGSTITVEKVSQ